MNSGIFNGKFKTVTFSFDDGNLDDKPLIDILNKYGLKGSFNVNSGLLTENAPWNFKGVKTVRHFNYIDIGNLYDGHEIAAHSYNHPDLTKLSANDIRNQISLDKKLLNFLFNTNVEGFAYPMGTFNDEIGEILLKNGLKYGRTTVATYNFDLPEKPIFWHPTCHFMDEKIEDLANDFLNLENTNAVFYIWGHSYELIDDKDYERFENLCKLLSGREDVAYLTNIEIIHALEDK